MNTGILNFGRIEYSWASFIPTLGISTNMHKGILYSKHAVAEFE